MTLPASFGTLDLQSPNSDRKQDAEAYSSLKRYFCDLDPSGVSDPTSIDKRTCSSTFSDQPTECSADNREQLGGKGMFLQRMKRAGLPVPPFECVTAQVMNALEQHPLDTRFLDLYLPGIVLEPGQRPAWRASVSTSMACRLQSKPKGIAGWWVWHNLLPVMTITNRLKILKRPDKSGDCAISSPHHSR